MKIMVNEVLRYAYLHPDLIGNGSKTVSYLGAGEGNANYLLKVGESKYVFRVSFRDEIGAALRNEFEILRDLRSGFGPEPIFLDDSRERFQLPFCILKYVEGKHVERWSKKHLRLHARKLGSLHEDTEKYFELDRRTRKLRSLSMSDQLEAEISDYSPLSACTGRLITFVRALLAQNSDLFAALECFSFCHGDPSNANILFTGNDIIYLDWEWAKYFDPASDLATLFHKEVALSPWRLRLRGERLRYFLDTYLEVRSDPTLKERVDVWGVYFMCVEILYCEWKVRNFSTQENIFPKTFYRNTANTLRPLLEKKLRAKGVRI